MGFDDVFGNYISTYLPTLTYLPTNVIIETKIMNKNKVFGHCIYLSQNITNK